MEGCLKVMREGLILISNLKEIALTVLIAFSVVSTALNGVLIASFIVTKQINKNTTNFLIFITSINDLLLGCMSVPLIAIGIFVNHLCLLFPMGSLALSALGMYSTLLTALVTVDRYLHMDPNVLITSKWRKRFKKYFKKPQIYACLLFSVIISTLYGWYIYERIKLVDELQNILRLIEETVGITGLSFLTGLYLKGYHGIKNHVAQSRVHLNQNSIGVIHRARYLQNLSKTVLLLVITLLLTYMPFCIVNIIYAVRKLVERHSGTKWLMLFYTLSYLLMCSNGTFNSVIVLYRNKEAKQWLFQKLPRCGCRMGRYGVQGEKRRQHSMKETGQSTEKFRAGTCDTVV